MTTSTMLEIMRIRWDQATGSTLTLDVAKKFLRSSVVHVETVDYNSGVVYSIADDTVTFTTDPEDTSGILYVYHALWSLQVSETTQKTINNELGVTWRSGLDSVSTSGVAKSSNELIKAFEAQYNDALDNVKIGNLGMTNIDLYYV